MGQIKSALGVAPTTSVFLDVELAMPIYQTVEALEADFYGFNPLYKDPDFRDPSDSLDPGQLPV